MKVRDFATHFRNKTNLIGTFVKLPTIHTIEMLSEAGLDLVVIDAEHAPIDRAALDVLLFAARALDLPALVRVPSSAAHHILAALDGGAVGVLVPHVDCVDTARAASDAAHYATGRGYSGAVRAMRGSGGLSEATTRADRDVLVIAQIEEPGGVDNAAAIAACAGVDGLFVGRADLAVAMGETESNSETIWRAAGRIGAAAASSGVVLSGFAANADDLRALRDVGATCIIHGSDQTLLRQAAARVRQEFHAGPAQSGRRTNDVDFKGAYDDEA